MVMIQIMKLVIQKFIDEFKNKRIKEEKRNKRETRNEK